MVHGYQIYYINILQSYLLDYESVFVLYHYLLILDECKTLRSEPKQAKQCTRLDRDLDGVTQSRL